ncbi:hypothetical protein [Vibrio tritonius]|uniref:hypothetical protein n=1 Tax=Vibrio tritonius TaxID=1435069 RepID=UPI000838489D|nr:hypothetical protein [Vibrio tritonius]
MTFTIIQEGNAHIAPEVHDAVLGTPCWSGMNDVCFDEPMKEALRKFISNQAANIAYMDAICGRDMLPLPLFDVSFLDGWPHLFWNAVYENTFNNAKESHDSVCITQIE